jgi:hypothetical protein
MSTYKESGEVLIKFRRKRRKKGTSRSNAQKTITPSFFLYCSIMVEAVALLQRSMGHLGKKKAVICSTSAVIEVARSVPCLETLIFKQMTVNSKINREEETIGISTRTRIVFRNDVEAVPR